MDEDQEKVFEDAKRVVKEQAYFMRKSIDEATLRNALKHAANMTGELRTNLLAPRDYYVLFMQVFDELRLLEGAFKEEYRRGRKLKDLYESVQHAGFVLPRIYLLITVGSVYIQTRDVSAKSILSDLMEMLKGVQHPLKGLFVRYYFLKMIKDKLPDTGSEYEGEGGDINDAVQIIVENLKEMNKLWIRVQSQGGKDKVRKEKERQDVKVTIGENLVRLSALNGCTLEVYQSTVLDSILQIITGTKDAMSQQYLMDCIIQAFPDEYHLHSLEKLLQTCGHMMQNNVDVKTIFIRLMDRLSEFAGNNEEVEDIKAKVDIFNLFKTNIDRIVEEQALQIELSKLLELQVAFLKFVSQCYPANIDYVNEILSSCCNLCSKRSNTEVNDDSQKNIVSLLTLPLESLSITVLSLNDYPKLMKFLPFKKRKIVAQNIARAVANSSINLRDLKIVNQLIDFLIPILKDDPENQDSDPTEFASEQTLVARIVHLAIHNDANQYYHMLNRFREVFLQGGEKRMAFTIPALFYAYLKLADFVHFSQNDASEQNYDPSSAPANYKVFNKNFKPFRGELTFNLHAIYTIGRELLQKLALHQPAICLHLNLSLVLSINHLIQGQQLDEFTYDICTDVLQIYQNEIADADAKISALTEITAAFQRLTCLSEENFDTLASNTTQYSAKLLKKSDQCLAILKCSHLFYCPALKSQNRLKECFKKVLKLAEVVNSSQLSNKNIGLYVAILNKFMYFLELDCDEAIKAEDLIACVQIIKEKSAALASQPDAKWLQTYFNNTLGLIEYKKNNNQKFRSFFA